MALAQHLEQIGIHASPSLVLTLEHALAAFSSSVLLLNEEVSTIEFANRLAVRGLHDPRILCLVHSLLIFEGTVSRRLGKFSCSITRARFDPLDFPQWAPQQPWSEDAISDWTSRNSVRLFLLS
jgi:hypothetical protein